MFLHKCLNVVSWNCRSNFGMFWVRATNVVDVAQHLVRRKIKGLKLKNGRKRTGTDWTSPRFSDVLIAVCLCFYHLFLFLFLFFDLGIKMELSHLMSWGSSHSMPFLSSSLAILSDSCQVLTMNKTIVLDESLRKEICPSLSPSQLLSLLQHYSSDEFDPQALPAEVIPYLENLVKKPTTTTTTTATTTMTSSPSSPKFDAFKYEAIRIKDVYDDR